MPAQESLEIEVKDFGPIVEAKVDLRPLTVFVGPSNTGKSYLAILIYALHRFFSTAHYREDWKPSGYSCAYHFVCSETAMRMPGGALADLAEWAKKTVADGMGSRNEKDILLPDIALGLLRSALVEMPEVVRDFHNEICRCFGVENIGTLIRNNSRDGSSIVCRRYASNDAEPFEYKLTFDAKRTEFIPTVPEETPIWIQGAAADKLTEQLRRITERIGDSAAGLRGGVETFHDVRHLMEDLAVKLASFAQPQAVGLLNSPAFYLPADRTGVMHAHTLVVSTLIGQAARAGLHPMTVKTPTLSGVLADFLQQLIELDYKGIMQYLLLDHEPFLDIDYLSSPLDAGGLAEQLEKSVLDGVVSIDKSKAIGYPRFMYRPRGWKRDLPLMNTSSMVSELAPVVLYLRHVLRGSDVLIVEEPESHLHPAKQVEFTRQLAAIVNSGVRVIVTTHSEWLLEELANLVRLSQIPQAQRNGIDGSDAALRPDQVGAWLFRPKNRPKGSVVERIDLDESGLYPAGFDDVAVTLHNNWAEITDRIRNGQ